MKPLTIWTRFQPTSTDPLLYDLAVHHITMRSVFASLVSNYRSGHIEPQVAKSWTVSDDKKIWTMVIDDKQTFSNGDSITPEIVLRNFKRVLLVKNSEHSKSALLEFLIGADKLKNINEDIAGLKIDGPKIIFNFSKPMPDFLDKVSFGLYAIAHPENYTDEGIWKNPKNVITSGSYKIDEWTDDKFSLKLREDLHANYLSSSSIQKINFNFSKNASDILDSDIMIKEKYNPLVQKGWSYSSTTEDNNIVYIQVMKWENKHSFLSKKENRTVLRNIFYDSLKESGLEPVTSFFPLSIYGVQSFSYDKNQSFNNHGKEFTTQPFFFTPSLNSKKDLGEVYSNAFKLFCNKTNSIAVNRDYPPTAEEEKSVYDIQFLGTEILIDSPDDDIRFMFNSKQRINLPDQTGEIHKILNSEKIDVQKVNALLWDQAIIWPVRHYSMGFWTKDSSNINLSELNFTLHPIDFQFIKWNN